LPELLISKAKFTPKRDIKMAPFLINCLLLTYIQPHGCWIQSQKGWHSVCG